MDTDPTGGGLTCEGSRGVGAGSQHFDRSQGIQGVDPPEGGPLLAVAQAQLTLAVPAAGEHPPLPRADESVVSAAGGQQDFLRFQGWREKKRDERRAGGPIRMGLAAAEVWGPPDRD